MPKKNEIKSLVTKKLNYLANVFLYKERTIAISFVTTAEQVDKLWKKHQLELASEFQYESGNGNAWDYYLVFLCSFDEDSFDSRIRFNIESDRFCCRKLFLFSMNKEEDREPLLVCKKLFPEIERRAPIQVISPERLLKKVSSKLKGPLGEDFFTKKFSDADIEKISKALTKRESNE